MVTAKTLNSLEFKTMDEYFYYIAESYINGQFSQVKDLFSKLSSRQKMECLKHATGERADYRDYIFNLVAELNLRKN